MLVVMEIKKPNLNSKHGTSLNQDNKLSQSDNEVRKSKWFGSC